MNQLKKLKTEILRKLYNIENIILLENSIVFEKNLIEYTINLEITDIVEIQYFISNILVEENYDVSKILYDNLEDYSIEISEEQLNTIFWINTLEKLFKQGEYLKKDITKLIRTIQALKHIHKSKIDWIYELLKQDLDME